MKITVFIFGLLAILLNHIVVGEPIKQNINQNNKNSGSIASDVIIGAKSPKRDSSDQTAVEDKSGQSQNYQPQVQYQSFLPVGQYFAQAPTQQVHYAKPEGGLEYTKTQGGVQYASSTYRPLAYQTIAYSAHHPNEPQQQHNGKLVAHAAPVQYNAPQVQYYALPQHGHQQIQYAIAVPAGHGHNHQFPPGYSHHGQQTAQIAFAVQPQVIYRGEATNAHYASVGSPAHHQQAPKYAVLVAAPAPVAVHQQPQIAYSKYSAAPVQQAIFYTPHSGQSYYAGHPANLGYYQQHAQPIYQHQAQQIYQHAQPAYVQYATKPIQPTAAPISVTPTPAAQAVHYKNYITTAASNSNHNGATSFATYSAQLPVTAQHDGGGPIQVIKAPVAYATTAAPIATYQQNGGSAGKIYYTSLPAQYQDAGQGYSHHGAIHYGQHLYHPSNNKAILIPSSPSTPQKY